MKVSLSTATAILIAVLVVFALPHLAFAQSQCVSSVTGSASANTVTTGTDFTISVTPASSESGCTVSTLTLPGTPTSYTISDPPASQSNQFSGFAAGTTKTFTLSTGAAGTYTFTPTATTSGGSISGTGVIVSAVDPSTLTVSATPSSAQINLSQAFTLTLAITGSASSSVTTSYTLTVPTGLTASGDPTSSSTQSVPANSSVSLSWTVNHTTCFTSSKTITFALGSNTAAASVTVTGNSSCTTSSNASSSSSSSGGSAGGTTSSLSAKTAKVSIVTVSTGSTKIIDVGLKSNDTSVRRLEFTASESAGGVQLIIDKITSRPSFVSVDPPSGAIFGYIVINLTNLSDSQVSSAKIDFSVNKSWISTNTLDKNKIALQRLSGSTWTKLDTVIFQEEADNIVYRATSPGLSVFSIWAEKPATTNATNQTAAPPEQPAAPAGGEEPVKPLTPETPEQPVQPVDFTTAMIYIAVIVIILVLAAGYFAMRKKPQSKYEYQKKYRS